MDPEDSVTGNQLEETGSESQDSETLDSQDTGTETQESAQSATVTVDWEAQAKLWQQNFQGLQGTVQQRTEALRAAQERQAQLEQALFEAATKDMEPEQKAAELQRFQQFQLFQQQEQQLKAREQMLAMREQMSEQQSEAYYARQYAAQLAQQYGVPAQELLEFDTPRSMRAAAEKLGRQLRAQRKQQRVQSGADQFEGTTQLGSTQRQKPRDLDEAAVNFATFMNRKYGKFL